MSKSWSYVASPCMRVGWMRNKTTMRAVLQLQALTTRLSLSPSNFVRRKSLWFDANRDNSQVRRIWPSTPVCMGRRSIKIAGRKVYACYLFDQIPVPLIFSSSRLHLFKGHTIATLVLLGCCLVHSIFQLLSFLFLSKLLFTTGSPRCKENKTILKDRKGSRVCVSPSSVTSLLLCYQVISANWPSNSQELMMWNS